LGQIAKIGESAKKRSARILQLPLYLGAKELWD